MPPTADATALAVPPAPLVPGPGTPEFDAAAADLARTFAEATAALRGHLDAAAAECRRLDAAFGKDATYARFDLDWYHCGRRYDAADVDRLLAQFKRTAWRILTDKLRLRDVMSLAKREQFDRQLEDGELPDITPGTIAGVLLGLAGQAADFAAEAAKEVFDLLRPGRHRRDEYKTNGDGFRVGRRVILTHQVERTYRNAFKPHYRREQELTAVDNTFHVLDGRGVVRRGKPPLVQAIEDSPDGRGETEYFRFRCFGNGNLHLEFKRLDLVKKLNGLAAGEYVLGEG